MPDNIAVTAGSGTTIAADDIGGVLHQRVKLSQGADGVGVDVSSAAPLQVTLANTGANATPVVVDLGANNDVTVTGSVAVTGTFYQATQPVSAAALPLPALAATSTIQADGSQKSQIVDGSGNVIGATSNALDVNIKSGASSGTQYADGAARSTATGTLLMVDDGTLIQSAAGTSAGVLKVDLSATTANATAVKVDGSAVTQPVSIASVPSHAVTNAGTFAVQNTAATPAGTNNIGDVDVLTINGVAPAFGTGLRGATVQRVTIATDDSVPVTIASVPSHNVTNAGTFAVQSTNQANSGVDIGDVTINNAAGASAVNIQDGGNSITVDGTVAVSGTVTVASHAVTNAGTFVTQENGALLTSSQLIDDAIVADNAGFTDGTTKLDMAGYIYDEVAGTALTENDAAAARINVNRAQVQTIEDGVTRGRYATVSAANALKVDGSAVTQPVSGTVTANAGTGTMAVSNTVLSVVGGGTEATAQRVTIASDSTGVLSVDDNGGSLTVDGTVTANAGTGTFAVSMATNTPLGTVAHDSADSGAPIKIGGRASSAEITAVTTGDRTDFITDLVGKQVVLPYANNENFVSGAITTAMTGTTSTSLVAAPAAGLRNYITTIIVSNSHATVGTDVIIQDGSGGTTLMTIPAAALYGGAVINLPVPLRQPTTATAIYCANVTTGASTKVSAVGYKGY